MSTLATKRSFVNKMEGKENIEGKFLINKAGALRLRHRSEDATASRGNEGSKPERALSLRV